MSCFPKQGHFSLVLEALHMHWGTEGALPGCSLNPDLHRVAGKARELGPVLLLWLLFLSHLCCIFGVHLAVYSGAQWHPAELGSAGGSSPSETLYKFNLVSKVVYPPGLE